MKKLGITFIAIIISVYSLYAQNKTIKGRVIAEDLEPVPLALIMINDTVEVGKADLNGFFQIEIPVSLNKLLFKFVGIEQTKIEIADTCDEVEVVMMLSKIYDFKTLKEVDKLRKKRFNKLPALHKEAFAKGIFKTYKACYKQEFLYSYNRKQK